MVVVDLVVLVKMVIVMMVLVVLADNYLQHSETPQAQLVILDLVEVYIGLPEEVAVVPEGLDLNHELVVMVVVDHQYLEERHLIMLDIVLLVLVMVLELITQPRVAELLQLLVDLVVVDQVIIDHLMQPNMVDVVVPVLSSLHILPK